MELNIDPRLETSVKVFHADGSVTDYGVVDQKTLTDEDLAELQSLVTDSQQLIGE